MTATNVDDIYELSPLQRGMLLHSVHDGSSDIYLGQHLYLVEGPLDADALVAAWRTVCNAHPSLRTSFHWEGLDKPLQVVHRDVSPRAIRQDWSDLDESEHRDRLDMLMIEERTTGFDLSTAPLQRLHLVRLGAERHALMWTHHHLLLDGWSVPIFMNEVMTHYRAGRVGGPVPSPAPPYRDYIAWLQHQDLAAAEAFWRQRLSGTMPTRIAGMRPADPRRATGLVERHVAGIADGTEDGLREVAARHHVTLNALVQAAWAVLLRRSSGRADVVFGCVSSGRPAELPDVDRMVGLFVNTLPVPVRVPDNGEIGSWLRDIQSGYADIRRYEFSPLSDIKRWAGVPGQQLFETLLVLDNYSYAVGADSTDELSVTAQTQFDKVSVPLSVIVTPGPVSEVQLLLHRDRFPDGFAEALLDDLLAVLRAFPDATDVADLLPAPGPMPAPPDPVDAATVPSTPTGPSTPPQSPEEEAIAAVYRDVLDLPDVDVTTSFFELGGDSFGAVRAVGRIEGASIALLATHPSVRALAAAVAAERAAAADDEVQDDELDDEIADLERQLAERRDREQRLAERTRTHPGTGPGGSSGGGVDRPRFTGQDGPPVGP